MPVIAQAGHLALAAQLAGRGQPAVEQAGRGHNKRRGGKKNVARALGVVVAVHLAQVLVEQLHETALVGRFALKLDEPLMMPFAALLGIDGRGRIVKHLGISFLRCHRNGMIGIMHHQFLAKGVDEAARAARYGDFDGIKLLDSDRVTQAVTPQPVSGGDDEFIGAARLNLPNGIDLRGLTVALLDGQELVEHAHIEQEQHRLA